MTNGQISSDGIEVFISYSHKDELLRAELENHLTILKRQKLISTWFDRKIGAGVEWKGQIDEHLDSAPIILLLISADFLASDYCYDIEMKHAMERHESGDARVIPIILRHAYWKGSPFSKLQALPTNAEPIKDGNWRSTDAAFEDVTEGLEKVIKSFKKDRTIHPIPSPKTIIVDQMHRGDFTAITEAIAAAAPGSRISIRPGVYDEGLVIDKPLEIVGDGEIGEVVIRASGKDAILFKTVRGKISNLLIRQNGGGKWYGVDISQGCLELIGCDITSDSLACVGVHGNAYPKIFSNMIHDGKSAGIFVYENGQGIIENNDIYGNSNSGVAIEDGGNPTLRRNKIHDGKSEGIFIYKNGQGLIEDNEIFGNDNSGVVIREGGKPTIKHNHINKNLYEAIWIYRSGAGTIEDNDLRENKRGAWDISEDSKSLVKRARNLE